MPKKYNENKNFYDDNRKEMAGIVDKDTQEINKEFEKWWKETGQETKIAGDELMFDMATSTTLERVQGVKMKLLRTLKNQITYGADMKNIHAYFMPGDPKYIGNFIKPEDYGTREKMQDEMSGDWMPDSDSPETELPDPNEPKMPKRKPGQSITEWRDSPEYIKWQKEHAEWQNKKNKYQ